MRKINIKKLDIKILNPKNLQKEIHLYGYDFELHTYLFSLAVLVISALALGKLLYLKRVGMIIIVVAFVFFLPFFIRNLFRIMYEQKRFLDVKIYIENILYAFMKRNGKILAALEDVEALYEDGEIKNAINEAAEFIRNGKYDNDLYQEALAIIGEKYSNQRLTAVHEFLIMVEFSGGDFKNSAELLIADNNEWEYNVSSLQQAKKAKLSEVYGAIVLGVVCCIVVLALQQNFLPKEMGIAALPVTQITSTALIIGEIIIVLAGQKKMTTDWLNTDVRESDKKVMEDYRYLENFNVRKERLESLLWAAPFFVAGILTFAVAGRKYLAAILLVAGYLMLHQHRLNYRVVYKLMENRIKVAFPQWVTRISLLLQTNNVQVAIGKSIDTAPAVLVPGLKGLLEEITESPHDIRSYLEFMSEFNQSDIRTTMQILFSIAETGNGDMEMQLHNLQSVNLKLKSEAERIKNQTILSDMELISGAPMVVCGLKQFSDLAVFMLYSLPVMGSMYQ